MGLELYFSYQNGAIFQIVPQVKTSCASFVKLHAL